MRVKALNLSPYQAMLDTLERIWQHRHTHPTTKSDELYYELMAQYYRRALHAREEGKFLIGHTVMMPVEIFYAMDLVPLHQEGSAMTATICLRSYERTFSVAKSYGMAPEICSAHRILGGNYLEGMLPRPHALVWSNQVCDNTAKSGDLLLQLYDMPGFFLDRPYRFTEREAQYFAGELGDMVAFLEEQSGHKMDWDRLRETLELSRRMIEVHREIYELRQAVPHPLANRRHVQMQGIHWLYAGTPEAIHYMEAVRDEAKALVAQGRGFAPQENYRLIALFLPPYHNWKLLDWMEREHGATIVADPYCSHWGDIEWDLSQPLLTLARKYFSSPVCRQMHGPMEEGVVEDSVNDALSHRAEGAIYWAHIGCRQACAAIKAVKDALRERTGIPTLVLDIDVIDPSFVTEEELKDKLEGFFELLAERK